MANDGDVPLSPTSGYAGLALVVLVIASWAVRKTTSIAFFHSTAGAALAGALSAVLPALIKVIEDHGLSWPALQTAIVGAALSYVASDNASNTSAEQKAKVMAMRSRRSGSATPPNLPITKASLLPLAFIALALSGCPSAGGQALRKCEMGQLPAVEEAVLADVGTIILAPASVVADLIALGVQLGPAQVGCAVQAWDAYLASKQTPTIKAEVAPVIAHALSLTRAYLAAHPTTSCRSSPRG
jgi:hypothetical protein